MNRLRAVLIAIAVLWIAVMLHRGQPLGWDEVEFFRATKWVGDGQVPFRDFWEHHTPLQWIVFAPVARLLANGPGVNAVVTLRWAQFAIWILTLALVLRLTREGSRWWALGMLLAAPLFVRSAIEYRVDALGNLFFIAAVVTAVRKRWVAFGALMSLAVLANMRLAPLVVITAIVMLFWNVDRWRWNPRALWMTGGVAMVAVPFVGWLLAVHAWQPFLDGVVHYNVASSALIEVHTLTDMLLAPVWLLDPSAIALWCAAIAGCGMAFRGIRRPGIEQIVALLFVASILTIAAMEVQYEYHFQGAYLLMVPLAALALGRLQKWQWVTLAVIAVALLVDLLPLASPSFGNELRYQDYVMREADRRTKPGDRVFDGTGYALRRTPAYRYWFLPAGLRFLASEQLVAGYDIAANPPAAIIYNLRMQRWFELFPDTAAYAVRHYVPITRDLWLPGMTAIVQPGRAVTWTAPAAGRFTLWTSEALVRHPWLTTPLDYASVQGPRAARYAIPLQRLPRADGVQWSVDGLAAHNATVELRKGSRVIVMASGKTAIGALLVPTGVSTLCIGPAEEFQF